MFGCRRGRIFLYHAHIGRSWCSCLPALVSAEPLPAGGLCHETGMSCSSWVLPTHLTQARVSRLPLTHHCAALPVARGHMRESPSALPPACGKQLRICRPLPRLRGLNCPFLKQVFATLSLCTKTSISTEHKNSSSHFSVPFAVRGFPAWNVGSVEKTHEVGGCAPAELCRCWGQAWDGQIVSITLLCSDKSSICFQNLYTFLS